MVRLSSELATHGAIDPVALASSTSKRRMSRSAFTARTASPAPRAPPTARMPDVMLVPTISATTSATLPLFSPQDDDVGAGAPGLGRSADLLWPWPFARTTPGPGSSRARSPMAWALLHHAGRRRRGFSTHARAAVHHHRLSAHVRLPAHLPHMDLSCGPPGSTRCPGSPLRR